MNKRNLIMGVLSLLLCPLLAKAETLTGAALNNAVSAANQSINSIGSITGKFIQTNPNGSSSGGKFWLNRPGKLRFEYAAPNPLLLVSNGKEVSIGNTKLKTVQRYPLRSTPLFFLLKPNVNLANDVSIISARKEQGFTILTLRDKKREANGDLNIIFNSSMKLIEWSIKDRQNQITRVQITEITAGTLLPASQYYIPDPPKTRITK